MTAYEHSLTANISAVFQSLYSSHCRRCS